MTPFSFEWQWSIGYFIFMGLLYLALAVIGGGLVFAFLRTWLDFSKEDSSKPSE
jgi:hypothetical protein